MKTIMYDLHDIKTQDYELSTENQEFSPVINFPKIEGKESMHEATRRIPYEKRNSQETTTFLKCSLGHCPHKRSLDKST